MENSKQSAEIEGSICDLEQMNLTDFALDDFVAKENNEAREIEKNKADLVEMKNEIISLKLANKIDSSCKLDMKLDSLEEYCKCIMLGKDVPQILCQKDYKVLVEPNRSNSDLSFNQPDYIIAANFEKQQQLHSKLKNTMETGSEGGSNQIPIRPNAAEIEERRTEAEIKSVVLSDAADFRQIVLTNTVMADHTLFLKKIWKERKNIGFFFPSRFGKTTLLSMAHFFFNIEIDKDSGLPLQYQWTDDRKMFLEKFPDSKILKDQAYKSMVGKRICIFMSLKCTNVRNYAELLNEFRFKFSLLFEEYLWLKKHLDADQQEIFARIKSGKSNGPNEVTDTDLKYALYHLANWLKKHFDNKLEQKQIHVGNYKKEDFEKVLIILDDFNSVSREAFRHSPQKDLRDHMRNFFDAIMTTTFQGNAHVRGIIAGNFALSDTYNFFNHTVLNGGDYAEYFGFNEEEFNHLCSAFSVKDSDKEAAKLWYNGYTIRGYNQKLFTVYNPQNIIRFLEDRKQQPNVPFDPSENDYLLEIVEIDKFDKLFKKKSIAETIKSLLEPNNPEKIEVDIVRDLRISHIDDLRMAAHDQSFDDKTRLKELFFALLLYAGYIDAAAEQPKRRHNLDSECQNCNIVIPNFLHRKKLIGRIKIYYEKRFKDFIQFIPDAQIALSNFYITAANNDNIAELNEEMGNFKRQLQRVVDKMPSHVDINQPCAPDTEGFTQNERIFHEIFDYMAMSLYNTSLFGTEVYCTCETSVYVVTTGKKVRSDTSFIDFKDKIGIQVEHKCDEKETVQDALQQSVGYFNIFEEHLNNGCIERILFIGTRFFKQQSEEDKHNDEASKNRLNEIKSGPKRTRPELKRVAKEKHKKK